MEIDEHVYDRDHKSHPLDFEVVTGIDRVDDLGPDAVEAEQVLDHERAGDQSPDVETR